MLNYVKSGKIKQYICCNSIYATYKKVNKIKLICCKGADQPVAWTEEVGTAKRHQETFGLDEYNCGNSLRDVHKVNMHQLVNLKYRFSITPQKNCGKG